MYLLLAEGYASTDDEELIRTELSNEAIRLGRILHRLLPQEGEVAGLLALMLVTDARRDARTGPDGVPIWLEEQDRRRWATDKLSEGRLLVTEALGAAPPGQYAVQVAIS